MFCTCLKSRIKLICLKIAKQPRINGTQLFMIFKKKIKWNEIIKKRVENIHCSDSRIKLNVFTCFSMILPNAHWKLNFQVILSSKTWFGWTRWNNDNQSRRSNRSILHSIPIEVNVFSMITSYSRNE